MNIDIGDVFLLADGRANWDDTFVAMATVLATLRGDCTRRKVGAIIYNPANGDFIEAGYNGAPRGVMGCLEGACPRGRHFQNPDKSLCNHKDFDSLFCHCGARWPCKDAVEPGSSYDTGPGACIAIHAEANALIRAGTRSRGMMMAVSAEPCDGCTKLLKGAQLRRVVSPTSEWIWDLSWRHDHLLLARSGANRTDPNRGPDRQAHPIRAVAQRRRLL